MPTIKAVQITKADAGFEQRPRALSRGLDDALVNATGPAANLRR